MDTKKPKSGGARLYEKNKRPILLGVTPAELAKLKRAAKSERRPVTQFLIHHGMIAADDVLNK